MKALHKLPSKKLFMLMMIIISLTNFQKSNTQKQNKRILQIESLDEIKKKATWETYEWEKNPFKNHTSSQIKNLLGLNSLHINEENLFSLIDDDDHSIEKSLPRNFDARKIWPECINEVRNQNQCGSCWAFSAASVLSDRFCIATNSTNKPYLSPQDMVSCDVSNNACNGGLLDKAWDYLEKYGIVQEDCFPYKSGDGKTIPQCPQGKCIDGDSKFAKFKAIAKSSKALKCVTQIKKEIFSNGPVQTGFYVYEDFMHYKSGIYQYTYGRKLGGHAVKIIGWGEDNGDAYWIVQNSWGITWGEEGFFRIKMGECMIDRNGFAGNADVGNIEFTPNTNKFLVE